MCLPFLLTFLCTVPFLIVQGRTISCACTTTHCQEEGVWTCNTTGLCFSEYLDRRDGSDPLVRGCILSRTDLMCQNRRPAVGLHRNWPVLICCDKNMCNAKVIPTAPTSTTPRYVAGSSTPNGLAESPGEAEIPRRDMHSTYVVVVAIGVCCFGVVTVLVVFLSRRHSPFCDPEFGNVGSNGYVKGCPEQTPTSSKGLENRVILDT